MQAQTLRQQTSISSQQSLAVIKTLLTVSFGCITYLRNLLPDDNFGEGRLTSGERGSVAYGSQESFIDRDSRQISGVSVKTVTRGFSTEADKLLNYLEYGIFDAIERQYLKTFIFAIYLDNDDPNNIVESYTYSFTYYTVPGTTTTVPIMTLDNQLNQLSLSSSSKAKNLDPVAQATLKGNAPTLGDVKQSVKSLVKTLILAAQSLEPLPKRRFATFKLFYRDHTPSEYEPPYFRPGDPVKDRFVFTTHDKSEVPEKFSIGAVVTPHHGINLQVQSVARYIPNGENNDSQYLGIESIGRNGLDTMRASVDPEARSVQLEIQRKDAEERRVVWSVEDPRWSDEDAEGDDDPDFVNDSGIVLDRPLGLRGPNGEIDPMNTQAADAMDTDEPDAKFMGKPDVAPDRLGQLGKKKTDQEDLEPTQQLESPASPTAQRAVFQSQEVSTESLEVDTQMLKKVFDQSVMDWTSGNEMLDMDTQPANVLRHDSIQSFSQEKISKRVSKRLPFLASDIKDVNEPVHCACKHDDDEDVVLCEACKKWHHIRCMGYHSLNDPRLPHEYICIPCRLQNDTKFELIKDKYPDILSDFVDLALFRRAIKIAETQNPESLKEFRKLSRCRASLAEQLWKRLEDEGFILLEVAESDKLGLLETRSRATRSTKKKVRSEKQVQRYVFQKASKKTALYRDYFSPNSEAEKRMIGLILKSRSKSTKSKSTKSEKRKDDECEVSPGLSNLKMREAPEENPVFTEDPQCIQMCTDSQTQEDTQFISTPTPTTADLKRRTGLIPEEMVHTKKKVKISVVEENVDIEE